MMTFYLRLFLLIASLLFMFVVYSAIAQKKLSVRDSLTWLLFSILLLGMAIFPQIVNKFMRLVGIATPSNFVFLFAIIILSLISFTLSMQVSGLNRDVRRLIQMNAIKDYSDRK